MNKKVFGLILPLLVLASCGGNDVPTSSEVSSGDSSSAPVVSGDTSYSGNTVTSILGLFGKNITSQFFLNTTSYKSKTDPCITTKYIENGVHFSYANFDSKFTPNGIIDIASGEKAGVEAGAYKFDGTDSVDPLVLGDKLTGVDSWREKFADPSIIGQNAASYASKFVPQIAGSMNGSFDITDATALNDMCKYLGAAESLKDLQFVPKSGTLYFPKSGSTFTFTIYSAYQGVGYDKLPCIFLFKDSGNTKIPAITNYLAD